MNYGADPGVGEQKEQERGTKRRHRCRGEKQAEVQQERRTAEGEPVCRQEECTGETCGSMVEDTPVKA
jgi:hypothetical protein